MIYALESVDQVKDDIWPLLQACWEEVDQLAEHMELDPDWEKFQQLQDMGMLRTYTSRNNEGEMVGFICVIIQSLLHSKGNYHAMTDVAYVKPEYRGKFTTLLSLVEEDLKEEGVGWFSFVLKSWDKRGKFLEDMGFTLFENTYQKKVN